mgnify:CR=1 FL=1
MEIVNVTKDNYKNEVLNSDKPVLIDFNADWCGPCRMLSPILEEVSKKNDNIKIVSINIDDEDELAEEYQVSSIPCLVYLKEGKEVKRQVGLLPKDALEKFIGE